jgi:predicted O-methyltransferase YrrM
MVFLKNLNCIGRHFKRLIKYGRGNRIIMKMIAGGVPETLKIPLLYFFNYHLSRYDKLKVARVEQIRRELAAKGNKKIEVFSSPPPSLSGTNVEQRPIPGKPIFYTAARLAKRVSCSRYWGTFLYLISQYTKARIILELGSAAGISGCYLASGQNCQRFITIEASKSLADIAKESIKQISDKAEIYNCFFDEALDSILPSLADDKLDIVWIDGHHEKTATLHYFNRVRPHLRENSLVLFHDIRWSEDMFDAWKILRNYKGFSHTIDLHSSGLCVWRDVLSSEPKFWDLT